MCITFDKMDKIGAEGVIGELTDKGFDGGAIAKFGEVIAKPLTVESVKMFAVKNLPKVLKQ